MKIGLDLRFLQKNDFYSNFVYKLVQNLIKERVEDTFQIYIPSKEAPLSGFNVKTILISDTPGSFSEQIHFLRQLNKDKNDLMIFFGYKKPLGYTKDYQVFIPSLKSIYYQDFHGRIDKYISLFMLKNTLKNSKKIICFDQISKDELIEKFNIHEQKISLLRGCFDTINHSKGVNLNLAGEYNIKSDFFIYSGGAGIEKNLDRLIGVFKRWKQDKRDVILVILGDEIAKDLTLRNKILSLKLQDKILFLGELKFEKRKMLYSQSLGVVFSSLYETFPFNLTDPLNLNIPIACSNIPSIKRVLGENVEYFSPISVTDIERKLLHIINNKKEYNYRNILTEYSLSNTTKDFCKIITSV